MWYLLQLLLSMFSCAGSDWLFANHLDLGASVRFEVGLISEFGAGVLCSQVLLEFDRAVCFPRNHVAVPASSRAAVLCTT